MEHAFAAAVADQLVGGVVCYRGRPWRVDSFEEASSAGGGLGERQTLCRAGAAYEVPWQPLLQHAAQPIGRHTGGDSSGTGGGLVGLMLVPSECGLHPLKTDVTQQARRRHGL